MSEKVYDVVVVGGGPAGLAAALSAKENGAESVLILERDHELGGILNQCIHSGFGLQWFKEELTGPEYAGRFIAQLEGTGIETALDTMVLSLDAQTHTVHAVSRTEGFRSIRGRAIVLAMGCRERTRGAIGTPGMRCSGVFTAGTAQRYVNMEGYMVGRRVLILGSGDIGLIMARRMTLEGAKVLACVEVMPYSGGLARNIAQCLDDFGIPLYLSHTIVDIQGDRRVERAVVAQVDEHRRPIPGTEITFDCDTILLSVGLIPENELTRGAGVEIDARTNGAVVRENMETESEGVFACGNVLHVHDLVDYVTAESRRAGAAAAAYARGERAEGGEITLKNGAGIGYTVPQRVRVQNCEKGVDVFFRVRAVYDGDLRIAAYSGGERIAAFRRTHLAPGEMGRVTLPRAILDKAGEGITLCVLEGAT